MGRRPREGSWKGLRAEVDCLNQLAYLRDGIRAPEVRHHHRLLAHRAIKTRIDRKLTPTQAIEDAYRAARGFVGQAALLSNTEYAAVGLLLAIHTSLNFGGRPRVTTTAEARAILAHEMTDPKVLPWEGNARTFRRPAADPNTGEKFSKQTVLLGKFVQVLDAMDPTASASAGVARTPAQGSGATAPAWDDLVGTWKGETVADSLFKHRPADEAPGGLRSEEARFAPTYMVIEVVNGELTVRWLYTAGLSTAIAVRQVDMPGGGRRLVCVYDADRDGSEDLGAPSHRGACLLDVQGLPASRVVGPYWNDRRADGQLRFEQLMPRLARTFAEAAGWRWPSKEPIGAAEN